MWEAKRIHIEETFIGGHNHTRDNPDFIGGDAG